MRMLGQIDHIDKRYNKTECEYEYQQTYPRHVTIGARPVNGSQRRARYGTQDGRMPIQDVIKQGRSIVHSLVHVGYKMKCSIITRTKAKYLTKTPKLYMYKFYLVYIFIFT